MESSNTLFPVFLKLEQLQLLIVGGGIIGLEKLQAVLNNSPATPITLVAKLISKEITELALQYPNLILVEKSYNSDDLQGKDVVIAAVNDIILATQIATDCRKASILINAADKPELCDFYLGSIVKKGNLKVAISTNGKSPTIAKRLKEMLNDILPEQIDELLDNMQAYRQQLKGDFEKKVNTLNEVTKTLVAKKLYQDPPPQGKLSWQIVVKFCLFAFLFMILGHALFSLIPFESLVQHSVLLTKKIDTHSFMLMLVAGFLAQMADGSLGMGYGTISTTFLLAIGINPAIVSSRVHSARVFSSGVSGYSHHRFGNINRKLFKALVIPGVIGAVLGAALAVYAKEYATYVRIPLSFYTIYLGYYIIKKAYTKRLVQDRVKGAGWLASIGGFMDAFAGGGWGALVTSTLISKRKNTRYVIGSVCLAEFFVVFASASTFFVLLHHIPIFDVLGLILGGMVAAPIAARLAGKVPVKKVLVAVGVLVILTSTNTLYKSAKTLQKEFAQTMSVGKK